MKQKPNPNCKECKGTGIIMLFYSSVECECVRKIPSSNARNWRSLLEIEEDGNLDWMDELFDNLRKDDDDI